MNNENVPNTIGMLLDIDHLYGEHEGRLAPILITLLIGSAPILLYIYLGLFAVIPIPLFVVVEIIIVLRTVMIILGRERHRVQLFKKQLNNDYTSTVEMLNIKTIHQDGCIEYINNRIAYVVCCFNGTSEDDIQRSMQLRKLLESMIGTFDYDVYIHNITESKALWDYYSKVSNFNRNTSARNFIDIIDHTIDLTSNTSMVQCTIYVVKGFRSDWKLIKTQIDSALNSRVSSCYKTIYRVEDTELINDILNRNIDSVINIQDLLRRKYATQQYSSSKVLAYDLPEGMELIQGKDAVDKVIDDTAPKKSFHVTYKET